MSTYYTWRADRVPRVMAEMTRRAAVRCGRELADLCAFAVITPFPTGARQRCDGPTTMRSSGGFHGPPRSFPTGPVAIESCDCTCRSALIPGAGVALDGRESCQHRYT